MKDEKIIDISKRRGFTNFWEAFDYMIMAGYSESDAIKIGLDIFNGNIWDNVITAKSDESNFDTPRYNGHTIIYTPVDEEVFLSNTTQGVEPDDLIVKIYIITKEGIPAYIPMYKAYLEIYNFDIETVPELSKQMKVIKIVLKTELAINLYKLGCKEF